MQNFLLTLAYDGTNYCGFQVQPNGSWQTRKGLTEGVRFLFCSFYTYLI